MSPEGGYGTPFERAMISISVMLATVMQTIDSTIANVALPHMTGSMSATQDQISWVLTSYIVAATITMPLTGVLAQRLGRRRMFLIMVVGFTIASMLCGAATSLPEIVIYRIFQGICGAGLVPLSQAVLLDTYPREKHTSAMALWGVGVMVGPILGPTLGGYLTENYSWRWVFYINLPFGILALLGILAFLPDGDRGRRRRFDFFGFALLALAIGTLQLMLDQGESNDWFESGEIIAYAALACLFLYMFVVHMNTKDEPFLEPELFRDRNFTVGMFIMFVVGVIMLSTVALLPPFLQNLMGYPVVTTGMVLAPRGFGTMLAMLAVGRLVRLIDPRLLVGLGLGLNAVALWLTSGFTTDVPASTIVWTGFIQGLGLGFIFVPLSTISFATLAPHYRNEGATLYNLVRNIGNSIGVSIVMAVFARNLQVNHAEFADVLTPFRDTMQAPWLPQIWNWHSEIGLMALNGEVNRQAATIAYLNDFIFMAWFTMLAAPLVLLLGKPPVPAAEAARAA